MAETTWCQNPKCAQKRMKHQIRGNKGNKWYQSNRASYYGAGYFCTLHCQEQWSAEFMGSALRALGGLITEPKKLMLADDWFFSADYNYDHTSQDEERHLYFLNNLNKNVKYRISKAQAQTPEQIRDEYGGWRTKPNEEAKPLAIQLGIA